MEYVEVNSETGFNINEVRISNPVFKKVRMFPQEDYIQEKM